MAIAGSVVDEIMRKRRNDPFFKYFRQVNRPDGVVTYARRQDLPPIARPPNYKDPGVTREAADIYKQKTGRAYTGTLLPVAKDSTFAKSSYAPKPKAKPKATLGGSKKKVKSLRTQRSLFGGDVRTLFPSQRRDLKRRRTARKQATKTKKTLGV